MVVGIHLHIPCLLYFDTTQYSSMHRRISVSSAPQLALTSPTDGPPHAFDYHISDKKGGFIFFQIVLAARAVLVQYPFSSSFLFDSKQTPPSLCLPSSNFVQDSFCPGPFLAPKAEYTVELTHRMLFYMVHLCLCRSSHLSTRLCFALCILSSKLSCIFQA